MKINKKTITITAIILFSFLAVLIVFLARSPVIIVSDQIIVPLYGNARLKKETRAASFSLFRPVRNIFLADEAGDDIVQFAIAEVSTRPFCVIFPLRYASAARLYREQNPETPIVLLEGRANTNLVFSLGTNTEDYFIYRSDIEGDFYRAGLTALAIDMASGNEESGKFVVFTDNNIRSMASEALGRALNTQENPPETRFFSSFSEYSEIRGVTCVIIAGPGAEFIENYPEIPAIMFTWTDPDYLPFEVLVVFNDSPWVQTVEAVRMVKADLTEGRILSRFFITNRKNIDKGTLRKIQDSG